MTTYSDVDVRTDLGGSTLAHWRGELSAAREELAELEKSAGSMAVDDPKQAPGLAVRMSAVRDRITIAEKAIAECEERIAEMNRVELGRALDDLEPKIAEAIAAIASHEAKTAKLRDALQSHTGHRWEAKADDRLAAERRLDPEWAGTIWQRGLPSPGAKLWMARLELEQARDMIQHVIDGGRIRVRWPRATLADLPGALKLTLVGTEGVPAPRELNVERDAARARIAELEQARAQAQAALNELVVRHAEAVEQKAHYAGGLQAEVREAERKRDEVQGRWHNARQTLINLGGKP